MCLSHPVAAVEISRRRALVFDVSPSPREPSTCYPLPLDEIRREPLHGRQRDSLRLVLVTWHVGLEAHSGEASRGDESRYELVHIEVRHTIDEANCPLPRSH